MKKYLLLAVVCCLLLSCENKIEDIYSIYFNDNILVEKARDIDLVYSDSARVQLRVSGPLLLKYTNPANPYEEFPEGLHVSFYGSGGTVTSWLDARYGLRQPSQNKVIVRDSVVMRNVNNEVLRTSELIWDEKEGTLYTSKYVEISRPGELIRGFGFRANEDMTRYEINAVTGRIKAQDIEADFQ